MANLSFTFQDWKRHRFEEEELNLNNFDFFNEGQMAESTSGSGLADIFVSSKWMVKLTGMYQLPYGISLTTFFQAREGNPQPPDEPQPVMWTNAGLFQFGVRVNF
jgi:hypothetical protein